MDTAAPIAATSGQSSAGALTVTAPSLIPTGQGAQTVGFFGMAGERTFLTPAGMTARAGAVLTSPAGAKVTTFVADESALSALATGPRVATANASGAGIGSLVGLRPAVPADVVAPSVPNGLGATAVSASTVAVGWSASTDNVGVAGYEVSFDGTLVDTTSQTAEVFTNLACASTHTVSVVAFDAAGNRSAPAVIAVSTDPCPDVTAPVIAFNQPLNGQTVSNAVVLDAQASDDTAVVGVQFAMDGIPIGPPLALAPYTTTFDSTQFADGMHTLTATATDAASNTTTATATITIHNQLNSAPVVDQVDLSPGVLMTRTRVTSAVAAHDPDGDAITLTYQWYLNGQPIAGANAAWLDLASPSNGDKGDTLGLSVVAQDATLSSVPVSAAPQTIVNSPPQVQAALSITSPDTDAVLGAQATATDDDGDPISFTFDWTVNGTKVATRHTSTAGDSLDLSVPGQGDYGDAVSVDVFADDGAAIATDARSATVTRPPVGTLVEHPAASGSVPSAITLGPDGNLWCTDEGLSEITSVTPGGLMTRVPLPGAGKLGGIATGADGNLWVSETTANRIARVTSGGVVTTYPVPTPGASLAGIAAGADGNLWFAEFGAGKIGLITTTGAVQEFPLPSAAAGPHGIARGPDGNVWFAEVKANKISSISPGGTLREFALPTKAASPFVVTTGPDGNVWFTEKAKDKVGRITPSGAITEFALPTPAAAPTGITAGADGNVWFTEKAANQIGRISPSGTITEYPAGASSAPNKITGGPDGNLWFTEAGKSSIGRITPGASLGGF